MLHPSDGIRETVQPSFLDLLEQRQKTNASTPTHSLDVNEERGQKVPPFVRQLRNKIKTGSLRRTAPLKLPQSTDQKIRAISRESTVMSQTSLPFL
jgi:hypothetical protein